MADIKDETAGGAETIEVTNVNDFTRLAVLELQTIADQGNTCAAAWIPKIREDPRGVFYMLGEMRVQLLQQRARNFRGYDKELDQVLEVMYGD